MKGKEQIMIIDYEYVATLLEKELEIISTHQRHDMSICNQISNVRQEDGLHDMVERLLYNRRLECVSKSINFENSEEICS